MEENDFIDVLLKLKNANWKPGISPLEKDLLIKSLFLESKLFAIESVIYSPDILKSKNNLELKEQVLSIARSKISVLLQEFSIKYFDS